MSLPPVFKLSVASLIATFSAACGHTIDQSSLDAAVPVGRSTMSFTAAEPQGPKPCDDSKHLVFTPMPNITWQVCNGL